MSKFITISDIIESAKKYGENNVLIWSPDKYRDNRTNKKQFDCTWVPITFKHVSGSEEPIKIKFTKVATSSGAKIPQSDGTIKNLNIVFNNVSEEDLLNESFANAEISEKLNNKVNTICKSTNEFVKAMKIMDASYKKICNDLKNATQLNFSIRKDKSIKDVNNISIHSICQTHREDKDNTDNTIELENPLIRIKLIINPKNGLVGIDTWNKNIKAFEYRPNVYDVEKMNKKNDYKPILATVDEDGVEAPLNKDNAQVFITYRSIVSGIIEFKEVVISKFGFSLNNRFIDLYVKSNKNSMKKNDFSKEDRQGLVDGESEEEEDIKSKKQDTSFNNLVSSDLENCAELSDDSD